ncbi:hypothetical protein ACFLX9_03660 [Chloroflexota bacterium]
MLKGSGLICRYSNRIGDIEDSVQSGIRFLGEEPVFLAGVDLSLKRGISVRVVPGWNQVRVPMMVAVAA